MKYHIEWVKFVDPLLPTDSLEQEDEDDGYGFIGQTWSDGRLHLSGYRRPYFYGPMGLIPLAEHNLPSKLYDLWVGHTNFRLTQKHMRILDQEVEGVEVVRVWSPYRFWLGVGRLFDSDEVKRAVERSLIPPPLPPSPDIVVPDPLVQSLLRQGGVWAVVCLPSGKREVIRGNNPQEVLRKTDSLQATIHNCSWRCLDNEDRVN